MEKNISEEKEYGLIIKGNGEIKGDTNFINKRSVKICSDNTQEDYESTNISNFGLKFLKKLGYNENDPKNTKPFEPQIRVKGVGLGVDNDLALIEKSKTEEIVEIKNRTLYGELFDIVDGKYKGFKCYLKDKSKTLDELYSKDLVHAELTNNNKEVKVSTRNLKIINHSTINNENIKDNIENEKLINNTKNLDTKNCDALIKKKKLEWIHENILVRIVNKNMPSLFMKKGVINQILDPYTFHIRILETGENLTTLKEEDVQTVIPKKTYTQMMGVKGEYKGQLLEYIGKLKGGNILVRVDNYKEVPISPDTLSELYIINKY